LEGAPLVTQPTEKEEKSFEESMCSPVFGAAVEETINFKKSQVSASFATQASFEQQNVTSLDQVSFESLCV